MDTATAKSGRYDLNSTIILPGNGQPAGDLDLRGSRITERELIEPIGPATTFLPYLQLFWTNRRRLLQTAVWAALASIAIAFLIPVRYQSVTRLMPPDGQSGAGL